MKFHWYLSIWWLDMLMHFLGGFWIGLATIWVFSLKNLFLNSIFKILLGFLIIGIGWEMFETLIDKSITQNPFNLLDALSDLCFGLSGAVFSIFYFLKIMTKKDIKV